MAPPVHCLFPGSQIVRGRPIGMSTHEHRFISDLLYGSTASSRRCTRTATYQNELGVIFGITNDVQSAQAHHCPPSVMVFS